MLLNAKQVTTAMQLTTGDVRRAMGQSGYTDDISSVTFMGMTCNGSFAYATDYIDLATGESETGMLYISYDDNGKLNAAY